MAGDDNRMTDGVTVERDLGDGVTVVTGGADAGEVVETTPVPERPSDGARKATWVDYVVALGADRDFVEGDTEHWDDAAAEHVTEPGLSVAELRELADRLGG